MSRQFALLAALRALLGAGGVMFLLGPLLLPEQFKSPVLSVAGLGLVLGLVMHAALRPGRRAGRRRQHRPDASSVDHLRCREAQTFPDLLDVQSNVILRRDAQGRLTYVNRAFCEMFGVSREDVLGTDFMPAILDQEDLEPQAGSDLDHTRRFTQRLGTAAGARWLAWEERTSPAADGKGFDILRIGRDITDERAVVSMLSRAREQAEEQSRQRSHLLTAMSHGIRRQIEWICGLSDRLLSAPQTPEQKGHVKGIGARARDLLELVDQVVELSEIEAGRAAIELAPFSLEQCIQEVAELAAPKAYAKGLELGWTLEAGVSDDIAGDEARLRRVLLNLVGNAIEATRRGGVLMSVALTQGATGQMSMAIRIESTSSDLAPDADLQLMLARRLVRSMGGDVAVEGGAGQVSAFMIELPLPLDAPAAGASGAERCTSPASVLVCSSLQIEAQALAAELSLVGADVTVIESDQAENALAPAAGGSEAYDFVFVDGATSPELAAVLLACAKERSPAGRVRGCVLVTGRQVEQLDAFRVAGLKDYLVRPVRRSSLRALLGLRAPSEDEHSSPPQLVGDAAGALAPGRHVLIAEDNPINAKLTECMVRRAGCTTAVVETGRAAVDAVRFSLEGQGPAIDLVLMDVHMPDLDGIAAAGEIRRLSNRSQDHVATGRSCPPLIAITASAFAEDRRSCLAAGMDDYLAKPFTWPEFQAVLARWLPPTRHAGSASSIKHRAA